MGQDERRVDPVAGHHPPTDGYRTRVRVRCPGARGHGCHLTDSTLSTLSTPPHRERASDPRAHGWPPGSGTGRTEGDVAGPGTTSPAQVRPGGLVRACETVAVLCQGSVLLCAPCRRRVRASGGGPPGGRGPGRRRRPRAGGPPPRAPGRAYLCILSWWAVGRENGGEGSRYAYGGTGPGGWGDPPPWAVRLPSWARGASCWRAEWLAPVPPRAGGGRGLVRCRPAVWSLGLSSRACGCLSWASASSCPIGPWSASAPCGCLSWSEGERLAVGLSSCPRRVCVVWRRRGTCSRGAGVRPRPDQGASWLGAGVLGAVTVRAGTAAWEPLSAGRGARVRVALLCRVRARRARDAVGGAGAGRGASSGTVVRCPRPRTAPSPSAVAPSPV